MDGQLTSWHHSKASSSQGAGQVRRVVRTDGHAAVLPRRLANVELDATTERHEPFKELTNSLTYMENELCQWSDEQGIVPNLMLVMGYNGRTGLPTTPFGLESLQPRVMQRTKTHSNNQKPILCGCSLQQHGIISNDEASISGELHKWCSTVVFVNHHYVCSVHLQLFGFAEGGSTFPVEGVRTQCQVELQPQFTCHLQNILQSARSSECPTVRKNIAMDGPLQPST